MRETFLPLQKDNPNFQNKCASRAEKIKQGKKGRHVLERDIAQACLLEFEVENEERLGHCQREIFLFFILENLFQNLCESFFAR